MKKKKYIIDDCHGYSFNKTTCVTSFQGSLIEHKKNSESMMLAGDKKMFVSTMKEFSMSKFESKEQNKPISPALFIDKDGAVSRRSKTTALGGKNVYLDIDNGTLMHGHLSKISLDIEIIFYSSYSHTKKSSDIALSF